MPSPSPNIESPRPPGEVRAPLVSKTFARLAIEPRPEDIFRCLGYPKASPPPPHMAAVIQEVVAQAVPHLHPRGTFSIYPLTRQTRRTLTIGGASIRGQISEFLHGARRIAVFLVTAGGEITNLAQARCRAGDTFAGWVIDAVGSWAAEATTEALLKLLEHHLGPEEGLTMRYSPGYCGMDLTEQRTLFQLAKPEAVGIVLGPSLLMEPLKSVSGIIGLGPRVEVGIHLSPCERCPLVGCHMRR